MKTAGARQARIEISIAAVLAGIFLLFIIGNPKVFTRFDIYYSFMSTIPFFGIMALAMTLVVTLGEMDLSFPSVLALSALLFGKVFTLTGNIWLAALVCLMVGLAAGAINAILIVRVGIPSLVATIGTMFFFRGLVNVIAQGKGIALVKAKETKAMGLTLILPGTPSESIGGRRNTTAKHIDEESFIHRSHYDLHCYSHSF